MKTDLETLNPTRVKLTVEVPFDELRPSLDAAYKKIAQQVQIPGFRKGRIPPRLIDQRFGRALVLEEAVNEALPRLYSDAVREREVDAVGQPEVDITELADGEALRFTAEVDVRPEITLPDLSDIEVVVDPAEVTEEDVEAQLQLLRERFGVLRGVDRPAQDGDFLSIDLSAHVGEVEVDSVSGLSYQVGGTTLLDGLDEAVRGLSAGESATFRTTLAGGEHAGEEAEVSVTVKTVKERELPELDDEFASTASEFDTVEELRADLRTRAGQSKRLQQGAQAQDKALQALLERVDFPLPQSAVAAEIDARRHQMHHELEGAGATLEQYLQSEGETQESLDEQLDSGAREAMRSQFLLDAIAAEEKIGVDQGELTAHILRRAAQLGVSPDEFADRIVQSNQIPLLMAEVVRGKALASVLAKIRIVDTTGAEVDLTALGVLPTTPADQEPGTDATAAGS